MICQKIKRKIKNKEIYRLPLLDDEKYCPVCGRSCTSHRDVLMKAEEGDIYVPAFYCDYCELSLLSKSMERDLLRYAHFDYYISMKVYEDNELEKIKSKMKKKCFVKRNANINKKEEKTIKQPEKEVDDEHDLYYIDFREEVCPICKGKLEDNKINIRTTQIHVEPMSIKKCTKCNRHFYKHKLIAKELILENPYARNYKIDGKFPEEIKQERELRLKQKDKLDFINRKLRENKDKRKQKEIQLQMPEPIGNMARFLQQLENKDRPGKYQLYIKEKVENGVINVNNNPLYIIISIKYEDGMQEDKIVIACDEEHIIDKDIISYKSIRGRELLTAVYREERLKRGILDNKSYKVVNYISSEFCDYAYMPSEFAFKSNSKHYDPELAARLEYMDVLIYSPFTDIYEIMTVSYDNKEEICYVSVKKYREFINKYGNPGIYFVGHLNKYKNGYRFSLLDSESLLKVYGYNVDSRENLTSRERWNILEEMVDLRLITVDKIVSHLSWCIEMHSADKYENARNKWLNDINHIEHYKINPSRFLIATVSSKNLRLV